MQNRRCYTLCTPNSPMRLGSLKIVITGAVAGSANTYSVLRTLQTMVCVSHGPVMQAMVIMVVLNNHDWLHDRKSYLYQLNFIFIILSRCAQPAR